MKIGRGTLEHSMAPPRPSATIDDPAPAPAPATQPKARRRRRTRMQRVIIGIGILAVCAILATIMAVGYGYYRFNQINKADVTLTKVGANKPQNYLVVGSDSRDGLDKSDPDYKAFVHGSDPSGSERAAHLRRQLARVGAAAGGLQRPIDGVEPER